MEKEIYAMIRFVKTILNFHYFVQYYLAGQINKY